MNHRRAGEEEKLTECSIDDSSSLPIIDVTPGYRKDTFHLRNRGALIQGCLRIAFVADTLAGHVSSFLVSTCCIISVEYQ